MEQKLKETLHESANQYDFRDTVNIQSILTKKKNTTSRLKYVLAPVMACLLVLSFIGSKYFIDNPSENPVIRIVEQSFVINPEDTRELVGFSHNVFIGKVIFQAGTKSRDVLPETQFKVEVLQNIKGNLEDTIKVNQQGGHKGNELILLEGDKLLEEGKTYLFATRYLEEENWHTLVPKYGDILINNEQEKEELIIKFTKAYKEEIPFN